MYTEILSFEEAAKRSGLGVDPEKLPDLSMLPAKVSRGMIALMKLQVIVDAVNNDDPKEPPFEADYNNGDQLKWFPWYRGGDKTGAGFRFCDTDCAWATTHSDGGARLALKDEARAEHMAKHFEDLYKELWLILEG